MQSIAQLNQQFGIPDVVRFSRARDGLIVAEVNNAAACAEIALQGAHVTAFEPHGAQGLIWLSEEARLAPGKSIRGGVPICWPWFGPHVSETGLPGHGYARTTDWRLIQVHALAEGLTQLVFELEENTATRAMWPHATPVRCIVTVGAELGVELETTNATDQTVTIGAALHTYFRVSDVRRVGISGLDGCAYLDKVAGGERRVQQGNVSIAGEVDRIYLATPSLCEILDPGLGRRIRIRSEGSHSTVVWNPGVEKANKMGDLGEDGYLQMLCVETANAADDVVTLAPGAVCRLKAIYSLAPI